MKKILAGGTGFLGKALEDYFKERMHEVVILTRHPSSHHPKLKVAIDQFFKDD